MAKNTKNNDTALIGCGYWGTNIAKVLTKVKKNKIIIYDENRSNSFILKKRFLNKIIISKNLNNILHNKNIKNVILATPPEQNYRLLKLCIENKKNIFIEKPGLKKYSDLLKIKKMNNLNLLGLSVHIGSQITSVKPFKKVLSVIDKIIEKTKI